RIPDRPPLHRDRHNEYGQRDLPVVREIRKDVQIIYAIWALHRREFVYKPLKAADLWEPDREICGRDHAGHLDEELDHIDHQNSPQPRMRGEDHIERADERERLPPFKAE